jgi:hypothetical protein
MGLATPLIRAKRDPAPWAISEVSFAGSNVNREATPVPASRSQTSCVCVTASVTSTAVRTDSDIYRDAARQDYQALVRLAGILAHERWHLRHGRDEVGAYTTQLSAMEYLHANSAHLAQVRRALRRVTQQTKK